jgi:Cu/Ag efflux pump CusA
LERAEARLKIVVPVTLLIIFLLLYLNFRRLTETLIVMLSLPFSLVGGIWLLWWLGFNLSVAVGGRIYRAGGRRGRDGRRHAHLPRPRPHRS